MGCEYPSLGEGKRILEKHRAYFESQEGVNGLGIVFREGRVKFAIQIDHPLAREQFDHLTEIEGMPICIEVARAHAADH